MTMKMEVIRQITRKFYCTTEKTGMSNPKGQIITVNVHTIETKLIIATCPNFWHCHGPQNLFYLKFPVFYLAACILLIAI